METRSKPDRPKKLVTLDASPAWIAWVDGMAEREGVSRSALIDQALRKYARSIRHEVKPPRR